MYQHLFAGAVGNKTERATTPIKERHTALLLETLHYCCVPTQFVHMTSTQQLRTPHLAAFSYAT